MRLRLHCSYSGTTFSFQTHQFCCSVFSVSLGGDKTLHLCCTISNTALITGSFAISFFVGLSFDKYHHSQRKKISKYGAFFLCVSVQRTRLWSWPGATARRFFSAGVPVEPHPARTVIKWSCAGSWGKGWAWKTASRYAYTASRLFGLPAWQLLPWAEEEVFLFTHSLSRVPQGFLKSCHQVSSVHQVFVEPLTSDDWEILVGEAQWPHSCAVVDACIV